ncbi:hypothetical protein ABW20_dc0101223 [Dactylellina cionopaga]|nr:hypothetical protein ABW20_dc0101223 [Dactylellina cionopaga]
MPFLDPSEVAALGLSPKDIPAYKSQASPLRANTSASSVQHYRTRNSSSSVTTRRNNRTSGTTSFTSSGSSTSSASASASPTLSTSRFTFGSGGETASGSSFEVCIKIPSKRRLVTLQRYERFPDADMATAVTEVDDSDTRVQWERRTETTTSGKRLRSAGPVETISSAAIADPERNAAPLSELEKKPGVASNASELNGPPAVADGQGDTPAVESEHVTKIEESIGAIVGKHSL